MRFLLFTSALVLLLACDKGAPTADEAPLTTPKRYLALGDSYTIGTAIHPDSAYPLLLIDSLQEEGFSDSIALQRVAVNGWTTQNLQSGIASAQPDSNFNVVTILIGVNNQYQRRSLSQYRKELKQLLNQSMVFAQGQPERVLAISIPDWSVTPAGAGQRERVGAEIDAFNAVKKELCDSLGIDYINITTLSRTGLNDPKLVASDGLHFSAQMHLLWRRELFAKWKQKILLP